MVGDRGVDFMEKFRATWFSENHLEKNILVGVVSFKMLAMKQVLLLFHRHSQAAQSWDPLHS